MSELNDIFEDDKDNLSDEELLKYLEGTASQDEMHAVEKKMVDSSFESEAVEGLQKFRSKDSLNDYVNQLNKNLHQQLNQKKQRKEKRKIKDLPLAVITVIIILILCILAFIVIHLFNKASHQVSKGKDQQTITVIRRE